jgi:hypothetical protein
MTASLLISDLLEQYMKERGCSDCWITVHELRSFFSQKSPSAQAISGFLGRSHNGAFPSCRYRVARITRFRDTVPPYRLIRRYLVQEREVLPQADHAGPVRLLY